MKVNCFIILFSIAPFLLFGQDTLNYKWSEQQKYSITPDGVWSVDGLGNVYISDNSVIQKFDSVGVLKFTQSIKSLGNMSAFLTINTMKLAHFSEEQQTLCYFDNTLTATDDCLELIDREVFNATKIASSERSDKVWVFDQVNSSLRLLDIEGDKKQGVQIDNLRGVLELNNITQIRERANKLYILDSLRGVFIFDMYGSFVDHIAVEHAKQVDANKNAVFILFKDKLLSVPMNGAREVDIMLPVAGVSEFVLKNQSFFFRSSQNVHKYRLQISK